MQHAAETPRTWPDLLAGPKTFLAPEGFLLDRAASTPSADPLGRFFAGVGQGMVFPGTSPSTRVKAPKLPDKLLRPAHLALYARCSEPAIDSAARALATMPSSSACWIVDAEPESVALAAIVGAWLGGGSFVALWLTEKRCAE